MNNTVLPALILGAAIVAAVAVYVYFSPYQTCLRETQGVYDTPAIQCAVILTRTQ